MHTHRNALLFLITCTTCIMSNPLRWWEKIYPNNISVKVSWTWNLVLSVQFQPDIHLFHNLSHPSIGETHGSSLRWCAVVYSLPISSIFPGLPLFYWWEERKNINKISYATILSKLSFMLVIISVYFVSNYEAVKAALLTPPIGPNDDITHGSSYGCVWCVLRS